MHTSTRTGMHTDTVVLYQVVSTKSNARHGDMGHDAIIHNSFLVCRKIRNTIAIISIEVAHLECKIHIL